MQELPKLLSSPALRERIFLAVAGLLQGIAVWAVVRINPHEPLEKAFWFGLLAWVLSSGLLFQFASSGTSPVRLSGTVVVLGVPFALFTYHVVGQLAPSGASYEGDGYRAGTWCAAATLALYILLPYIQIYQRSSRLEFPYTELYRHSWNNFFLAGLGWFYTGVYWALVWTCAGLFKALGIDAIQQLISKPSFIAVTTGLMGGVGIALAKEHAQTITTLRSVAAALFRSLTPLLVIIVLSFLAMLPFTGLQPLWATKWASSILLAILLLILLFVNAVFQDGGSPCPYGTLLRRGVEATLAAMPILAGLTIYSMNLRISQYGFTPERYYAIVFALVLGAYGVGYAWSAVETSSRWLGKIRRFNVAFSFLVFGLAFALHSPLMDPLKRSAEDQERRFLSGIVDVAHLDFGTLRFDLGHYGQAVLDRLAQLTAHPEHQRIADQLARLSKARHKWDWANAVPLVTPQEVLAKLTVFPPGHIIPEDLLTHIQKRSNRYLFEGCSTAHPCDMVAGQWDDDPETEYVFLNGCGHTTTPCPHYTVALYKRLDSTMWKQIASVSVDGSSPQLSRDSVLLAVREGRIAFNGTQYHCLTVRGAPRVCDHWGTEHE